MKLAIPTREGRVDHHFGHCAYYTVVEIDDSSSVISKSTLDSPEGCGCKSDIAYRMQDMGITLMLAGNMGQGAVNKLTSCGITVIKGCEGDVDALVRDYLEGKVKDNAVVCDHHECHDSSAAGFRIAPIEK